MLMGGVGSNVKIWKLNGVKKKTPLWINMWIETKASWQWIHQLTWLAQHFESLQNDCGILFNPALRKQMEKKHFFSSTFSLLFPEKKNFPLNVNFHSIACSDNHNFDYRQLIARRWIALHLIHPNLTTVLSWNFTNFSLNRLPPDCNKNMNWESFFFCWFSGGKIDFPARNWSFQRWEKALRAHMADTCWMLFVLLSNRMLFEFCVCQHSCSIILNFNINA